MIICALNQNMLALHFSKILATDDDNKGLNCFHPAFHGKHALVPARALDLHRATLSRYELFAGKETTVLTIDRVMVSDCLFQFADYIWFPMEQLMCMG
jgi:hypothetical protein